uniref:CTP synthase n=1 Tax=Metchnikovella dogieli TaxID=2804710 RepID=A0A896WPG2_9MICR|nr:CTP synthase isoform X1 [Metchnikovella dogieli]
MGRKAKHVLLTGGLVSGLGKGSVLAGIGRSLQDRGIVVNVIKIDPYLNEDAGGMSPAEHGEVFVLEGGEEVDQDFGVYERELELILSGKNNITTGKMWKRIREKERRGDYGGRTVQYFPDFVNEIEEWLSSVSQTTMTRKGIQPADVCLIELGGGLSSYEIDIYLEAFGRLRSKYGKENFLHIHLDVLVDVLGQFKTLPIQDSINRLKRKQLTPDLLLYRHKNEINSGAKVKLSETCMVENLFDIPFLENKEQLCGFLSKSGVVECISEQLKLELKSEKGLVAEWKRLHRLAPEPGKVVRIGIVAKYNINHDAYLSLTKAICDCARSLRYSVEITIIDAEQLEEGLEAAIAKLLIADGILVAGGFGVRGVNGKIMACKHAREKRIPYLGICLGMQVVVIEAARNLLGLYDATSTEFDPETANKIILKTENSKENQGGGSMCLGAKKSEILLEDSLAKKIYKNSFVIERHRHRYEMNVEYAEALKEKGVVVTMVDEKTRMPSFVEVRGHPFMVGTQSHPEFTSSIFTPSPIYCEFLKAALENKKCKTSMGLNTTNE